MLLQSVNSCSNEQVIGYCSIFFKPSNSPVNMQSWTKMLRQFRETNAFEQTQNFVLEWKLFHRMSPTLARNNVAKRRSWVQFPPWSEFFFYPCVGPNPVLRLIPNGVIGYKKLHNSLRPHSKLKSLLSIGYGWTTANDYLSSSF